MKSNSFWSSLLLIASLVLLVIAAYYIKSNVLGSESPESRVALKELGKYYEYVERCENTICKVPFYRNSNCQKASEQRSVAGHSLIHARGLDPHSNIFFYVLNKRELKAYSKTLELEAGLSFYNSTVCGRNVSRVPRLDE